MTNLKYGSTIHTAPADQPAEWWMYLILVLVCLVVSGLLVLDLIKPEWRRTMGGEGSDG